jgi:hypothetical protein
MGSILETESTGVCAGLESRRSYGTALTVRVGNSELLRAKRDKDCLND